MIKAEEISKNLPYIFISFHPEIYIGSDIAQIWVFKREKSLFKTLTEPCIKALGSSTLQIPDAPIRGSVLSKHTAGIGHTPRTAEQAPTHVIENKSAVLGLFFFLLQVAIAAGL